MSNPLVSIVVPTYKRTKYLKLTLESVKNQTYQNFEVIVVDDGTPNDDNQKLCNQFEKVKYIKIENSGGPAKPRNVGIKEARGEYIAFVDDDDLWLAGKLEKQVSILENNPDFGLVHCCCQIIDENGIKKDEIIGRPGSPDVKHGDVSLRMFGSWTLMMPTPMVRKEVIEEVGLFNEIMPPAGEDVEYWTRCSFVTKFYYIDEPLAYYRVHENGISRNTLKYQKLNFHLKKVLVAQRENGKISIKDYRIILNKMCSNHISSIKDHYGLTLKNLFDIDRLWFLRFKNLKVFLYTLLFR